MRNCFPVLTVAFLSGCAALGGPSFQTGPEFDQTVRLMVDDDYRNFQAVRSTYDAGDLQAFHSQHTFPVLVQDAFEDLFGGVERVKPGAGLEAGAPPVPAVFEVRMVDLAHDIYMEADNYRAQTTLAVAMKNAAGEVLWQEAFRGEGYVTVDPQFSMGLGPQDAVVDAVGDALYQMQKAIADSPAVSRQLKDFQPRRPARREPGIKFDLKDETAVQ